MSDTKQRDTFLNKFRKFFHRQGKIQSLWLVIIFCFLFKLGKLLLGASMRLDVYNIVCSMVMNYTDFEDCRLKSGKGVHLIPKISRTISSNPLSKYEENLVQHRATVWLTAYRLGLNLPIILLFCICAKWTDKWGRVPFMIVSSVGILLSIAVYAGTLHPDIKISYISLGMIVAGSLFSEARFISIGCNSYIVDLTTKQERTRYMSRLEALNCFGGFFGWLMVGITQQFMSLEYVLIMVAGLNVLLLLTELFLIKDSIGDLDSDATEQSNDVEESPSKPSLCSSDSSDSILTLFKERLGSNRKYVIILLIVLTTHYLSKDGESNTLLLYVKHSPLAWEDSLYGYYMAMNRISMGLFLIIAIPILHKYCPINDSLLVCISLALKSIRLFVIAFCPNTYVIFSISVLNIASGFIPSGCKSILSKLVDKSETGRLFSLLSVIRSVSNVLGPIISFGLYAATVEFYPGSVFVIEAIATVICAALVLVLPRKSEYEEIK